MNNTVNRASLGAKKNKLFKSGFCEKLKLLLIPIGLLIGSFTTMQVWAGVNFAKNSDMDFYVDVSATSANWKDHVALGFGNDEASFKVPGTHISHTRLWYCYVNTNWSALWWIVAYDANWGTGNAGAYSNYSNDIGAAWVSSQYMSDYTINANAITLIVVGSESSNPTLSLSNVHNNRNYDYINYDINLQSYVKEGVNDYASANAKGAVSAESYRIYGNQTTSEATSASLSTSQNSTTLRCARTAETSFSVGSCSSGYEFVGWYDEDGNQLSTATNYTNYNPQRSGAYVRAYFAQTHTVNISAGTGGEVSVSGDQTIGQNGLVVTATPNTGYMFDGWDHTGGVSLSSSDATMTITATAAGTVTARFVPIWSIKGSEEMGAWDAFNNLIYVSGTTYSTTIELTQNKTYEFKVYNRSVSGGEQWYGYNSGELYTTFTREGTLSQEGLANSTNNLKITTDANLSGTYTFTWNTTGNVISVTYPTPEYSITYKDQGNVAFTGTQSDPPITHTYGTATTLKIPTKTGYDFAGWWTDAACTATQVGTNSAASLAADGYTADITLYAKWTVHTTTITLNDRSATDAVSPSSVTATYDSETLASITNPKKWGYTFGGWVLNSDGTGYPIIDTDGNLVAAKDDYTDGDGKWIYDERTLTLYAQWTPSLYWVSGSGSEVTGTAFTDLGGGVYRATVTMSKDGTFHLGDGTTAAGPASNQSFATPEGTFAIAPSSYYFTYTGTADQTIVCVYDYSTSQLSIGHVVFYLGAKGGSHAKVSDYEGWHSDIATISGKFEYRMLVVAEDTWSSLCLPFGPTEVKVWSGSAYYDVLPYYRDGGTFYKGHYIIRTPGSNTIPLSSFGSEWKDPASAAFKPSGSTPYIIQWHDNGYFAGKYISFFGNGASLAQYSGAPGAVAADDAHVNLYGNTAMTGLSVKNGYLLNDGVWTRGELGDDAYVGPFECYIRASEAVAKKARRIQSGITVEDTATGWEDVLNSLEKPQIKVYNISGNCVAQYQNCSFDEAARRLSEEYREGVYILHAGNESVKLFVNGK